MAEMIPPTISADSSATAGEKRFFNLLKDALIPDDDYIVWYEPKAFNRYSDFIVWGQGFGLLVIEVKDWRINQIRTADPKYFKGSFYGKEQTVLNPLEQARNCSMKVSDLVKQHRDLLVHNGEQRNKPKFPIAHCAAFTGITRKEAAGYDMLNPQVLSTNQVLFEDDLRFDTTDTTACREFKKKLRRAFIVTFPFDPLTYNELKVLRYALFPEIRVSQLRRTKEQESIRTLDLRQERTAKSIGEGHRILKGVAGSGKTLVLASRAAYLSRLHQAWKILVVCYNVSLSKSLRQLISSYLPETPQTNIDVFHIYGLVKNLTEADLSYDDLRFQEWEEKVIDGFKEGLKTGEVPKGVYDAILVDEGQDFSTAWIQCLVDLLKPTSDSFLFCYDPAQRVFNQRKPNWKAAGLNVQGKKPIELKKSYRNTVEILSVAMKFARLPAHANDDKVESDLDSVLFPEIDTTRHGALPILKQSPTLGAQIDYILASIREYVESGDYTWGDICVLYRGFKTNFAESFVNRFRQEFGEHVYWVSENMQKKRLLDVTSSSVKLSTVASAKGMEFRVVFVVEMDQGGEDESNRATAYVAMTRAQDVLQIVYQSKSPFIVELEQIIASVQSSST